MVGVNKSGSEKTVILISFRDLIRAHGESRSNVGPVESPETNERSDSDKNYCGGKWLHSRKLKK